MARNHTNDVSCRRHLLVMALTAAFGFAKVDAGAASFPVSNCLDSGVGSLRAQIAAASEGSIIDLSQLDATKDGCSQSTITLTSGEIPITQSSVTIAGSTTNRFIVEPSSVHASRIFKHTGAGLLTISNLSIQNGGYYLKHNLGRGGCIYSAGSVELDAMAISGCYANATRATASGGAVYASGQVALNTSAITSSTVNAYAAEARGGAVAAGQSVVMAGSTISGNRSVSDHLSFALGGGVWVGSGFAKIYSSLIANNTANGYDQSRSYGGGIATNNVGSFKLVNSTVANNTANSKGAGVFLVATPMADGDVTIANATIAFNTQYGTQTAAGIYVNQQGKPYGLSLNSTLISNNAAGGAASDAQFDVTQITGAKNLIFAVSGAAPADTIVGACPRLGILRDNGGPTATVALLSGSPAINAGNNVLAIPLTTDQRLAGYPRSSGGAPDIGAYEVQADVVFDANFDGCF